MEAELISADFESFKHIGLFEGIGGFSLAAEWAGWETKAWVECNPFCQKVLSYYFPNAIPHDDITTTDFSIYRGHIDVLTGGFPCQGFSLAGSRLGTDDDRYLWPEMRRAYQEIQPSIIIGENVTGLLSMEDKSGIHRDVFARVESKTITRLCEIDKYEAIYTRQAKMLVDSICNDLEEDGYEVQPIAIPASSVQAPHQRERIWFIAYRNGYDAGRSGYGKIRPAPSISESEEEKWKRIWNNFERTGFKRNVTNSHGERPQKPNVSPGRKKSGFDTRTDNERNVSNAASEGLEKPGQTRIRELQKENGSGFHDRFEQLCCGNDTHTIGLGLRGESNGIGKPGLFGETGAPNDWRNFPTELPILSGDDGFSSRLDGITFSKFRTQSIKSAGNAVVPQVPYEFFKEINKQIKSNL